MSLRRYQKRMRARRRNMFICIFVAFALLFVGIVSYGNDYYRADSKAIESFMQDINIIEETLDDGSIACIPEAPTAGIIFYPGHKVEHTAYVPLMRTLADNGILSVTVKMPFNVPSLKRSAAEEIKAQFPEISNWYLAGHAEGGTAAAYHIEENSEGYDGLILLASYSTKDISKTGLKVATIFGSGDKIMDRNAYDENKTNLPEGFAAYVIQGANHSGFGMYGLEEGDDAATITNTRQIKEAADIIAEFINN